MTRLAQRLEHLTYIYGLSISCILMTSHLYSVLRQLRLHGQHLSGINVRVVGLVEGFLQLLQLVGREHRPAHKQHLIFSESLNKLSFKYYEMRFIHDQLFLKESARDIKDNTK